MRAPVLDADEAAAEIRLAAALAGPVAALGLAGALVAWRSALGVANVGFVMMLVVLAAGATGGRAAGVLTAVVAALAFNLFHTQPYLSLAVAARQDAISVGVLAAAGAVVGEVGARSGQRKRAQQRLQAAQRDVDAVLRAVADGAGTEEAWPLLQRGVRTQVPAGACTFQRHTETAGTPDDELARTYVVPVIGDGALLGHLLVTLDTVRPNGAQSELLRRSASLLALAIHRDGTVAEQLR
ncbi:MAG: DUF4118 domain-containing protein [Acidimicrobiales bacterium]